jgi:hypothetical protein
MPILRFKNKKNTLSVKHNKFQKDYKKNGANSLEVAKGVGRV